MLDLGLQAHVVEFASRLMPRQLDDRGSQVLIGHIERLGATVHLGKGTQAVVGEQGVTGWRFRMAPHCRSTWSSFRPASDLGTSWRGRAASTWDLAAGSS